MRPSCPNQRLDLSVREVDSEVIVLDRQANQIHQLNYTASFIWRRCDGRHSTDDIIREFTECFGVAPDVARDAVVASVRQLDALGLLSPTPEQL
jgi:hypothetical protein